MLRVVGGIGTAIAIHYVPIFIEFRKFKEVVIVWLIGAAVCDVAITIALSLYLVRISISLSILSTITLCIHLSSGNTKPASHRQMVY